MEYEKVRTKYDKLGNAGIEGILFQVNLLTVCMLNAVKNIEPWRLSTENRKADNFDDVVLESPMGDILLQAKHRSNKEKKITRENLLSVNPKNDDFSLPKYYFAYHNIKNKFDVKNIILCTNANIHIEDEFVKECTSLNDKHPLYFGGVHNVCYKFDDGIIPALKDNIQKYYERKMKEKNLTQDIVEDENIKDFLNHLQFIANYPSGKNLDDFIIALISQSEFSLNLNSPYCFKYIHIKMMQWFKETGGRYLYSHDVQALFSDIRSNNYCDTLRQYDIYFETTKSFTDAEADDNWKILHIINKRNTIFNEIKIYQALEQDKGTDLFLFLNQNSGKKIQMQMVDTFRIPRYIYLIIVCSERAEENMTCLMCDKIDRILKDNPYKKVILIAKEDNELVRRLRCTSDKPCLSVYDKISFNDFTKETKEKFLYKTVIFQGEMISLIDLLEPISKEDLNDLMDPDVLFLLEGNPEINIGCELKSTKNTEYCYIHRIFFESCYTRIPEEELYTINFEEENIALISDSPGMGKSTVLTSLIKGIKRNNPKFWVVRVDLITYTKILSAYRNQNLETIGVTELLNSQEITKFKNILEKKIFFLQKKVIMMIDGIDEISPDYLNLVLGFILDCQISPNIAKVYVTSRPHLRDRLKRMLNVTVFTLNVFSVDNQIEFLKMYWTTQLHIQDETEEKRCEVYAQRLITKISMCIDEKLHECPFAGIPLHLKMIAEVFQEYCNNFLTTNRDEPSLSERINLFSLYQMFIERKRKIFVHDKGSRGGIPIADEALQRIFDDCRIYYRILALEVILNENDYERFSYYRKHYKENPEEKYLLKIGIVEKLGARIYFVHRTLAEYFLAECLLIELKNGRPNKQFLTLLLDKLLIKYNYNIIRAFFDSFLQNDVNPLPNNSFPIYSSIEYAFRFVNIRNRRRNTLLHILSIEDCTGILYFLFRWINMENIRNPVRRCIMQLVIQMVNVDIKNEYCRTPLHLAARLGHLEVVKFLTELGANINLKDKEGRSAFHEAARWGNFEIVKYLAEKNAKLNIRDKYGHSPLYDSIRRGHNRIAVLLHKKGAVIRA